MLKVVYCRDGQTISDFAACDFADNTIRNYLCSKNDMEVRVANEIVRDAFVLRLMEEKLSPDEIEFYWEDIKLTFDMVDGLVAPDSVNVDDLCLFAKMTYKIIKLGYDNLRARELSEKNGQHQNN